MGQSEASASVWRYNVRMVTKIHRNARSMAHTPVAIMRDIRFLTPDERAEFIDSIREDEALSPTTDCDHFDPAYND